MPDRCSCGAALYPDSLFCHKCGKPQRDLHPEADLHAEPEPAPPHRDPAPAVLAAQPEPIGFHNRIAMRTAIGTAALVTVLQMIPLPAVLQMFWMVVLLAVAGFAAVYVYHRRTGVYLTVGGGARIGWLTGMFSFLMLTVLLGLAILLTSGKPFEEVRQQLRANPAAAADAQAIALIDSAAGMGILLAITLLFLFVIFTLLSMVGGAVGAKVLEQE